MPMIADLRWTLDARLRMSSSQDQRRPASIKNGDRDERTRVIMSQVIVRMESLVRNGDHRAATTDEPLQPVTSADATLVHSDAQSSVDDHGSPHFYEQGHFIEDADFYETRNFHGGKGANIYETAKISGSDNRCDSPVYQNSAATPNHIGFGPFCDLPFFPLQDSLAWTAQSHHYPRTNVYPNQFCLSYPSSPYYAAPQGPSYWLGGHSTPSPYQKRVMYDSRDPLKSIIDFNMIAINDEDPTSYSSLMESPEPGTEPALMLSTSEYEEILQELVLLMDMIFSDEYLQGCEVFLSEIFRNDRGYVGTRFLLETWESLSKFSFGRGHLLIEAAKRSTFLSASSNALFIKRKIPLPFHLVVQAKRLLQRNIMPPGFQSKSLLYFTQSGNPHISVHEMGKTGERCASGWHSRKDRVHKMDGKFLGIVGELMPTYGFIYCLDDYIPSRLFFPFSNVSQGA